MELKVNNSYNVSCVSIDTALEQEHSTRAPLQKVIFPETIPGIQDLYSLIEGASKTLPEGTTTVHDGFVITGQWNSVDVVVRSAIDYLIHNNDVTPTDVGFHKERLRAIIASPSDEQSRKRIETLSIGANNFYSVYGLLQFYLVPKK